KSAPSKSTDLIGSETRPDILTGPDIAKDHTIESPMQAVGDGWKMILYLVPTLVFVMVCLNLLRRYQVRTGRLPAGLTADRRDKGSTSSGIAGAIASLLS